MTDFGRTVGDARKNLMHDADGPNTGPDAEQPYDVPLFDTYAEVERLRAEVERLTEERDQRAQIMWEANDSASEKALLATEWKKEADAARAEVRALRERIAGLADDLTRQAESARADSNAAENDDDASYWLGMRDANIDAASDTRALLDPGPPVADSEGGERDE